MNSNQLHSLFGKKANLSRKDIADYGKSTDHATHNQIEANASGHDFDTDALEGWSQAGYDVSAMKSLDKRFKSVNYSYFYFTGITGLVLTILIGFYIVNSLSNKELEQTIDQKDQIISDLKTTQQITLDESDVIIPVNIEEMETAPRKEQIALKEIKSDFDEKKNANAPITIIELESLPITGIPIENETGKEVTREHFVAKEIYLHDLKLVDYRKYRSNPTVKTKQIILSGTPANQETQESESIEPEWKEVEVPYMEYLNKTMQIFEKGQYKKALTRYETILAAYPQDVNANFYGALCLFNLSEYNQSIQLMEACIAGKYSNFDEEAQWTIALAYEKLGKINEAKLIFKSIVDQNGYYKIQAQKKLK